MPVSVIRFKFKHSMDLACALRALSASFVVVVSTAKPHNVDPLSEIVFSLLSVIIAADRNLVMIGYRNNTPHFYLFDKEVIDSLEPFGDLIDYVSVGIKDNKIQVVPWEYSVVHSPKEMETIHLQQVVDHAASNSTKKQRYNMKFLCRTDRWETFYGWQMAHQWLEGTDSDNRRIHVFFRPIREETPTARIRTKKTGEPMNYTYYNNK